MKSVKKRKKLEINTSVFLEITVKCKEWLKSKQHKWQNAISNKWMLIEGSDDSECMGNTLYIFIMIQVSLVHFPGFLNVKLGEKIL